MKEKTVGIIGGMGPEATVDLMRRVIELTPAADDQDHVRMLVDNNPKVPSRIKAIIDGSGESPAACLAGMARGLEKQGAHLLAIPCNTAHYYYDDIAAAVSIPLLNVLQLASQSIARTDGAVGQVGILASSAVQRIALFESRFQALDMALLYPETHHQKAVMGLIRNVKAKRWTSEHIAAYNAAAKSLADRGAQCLMVACTELSLVGNLLTSALPIHDTANILAKEIVRRAKGA